MRRPIETTHLALTNSNNSENVVDADVVDEANDDNVTEKKTLFSLLSLIDKNKKKKHTIEEILITMCVYYF